MKKANLSAKKDIARSAVKSQRKISAYFASQSKNASSRDKDGNAVNLPLIAINENSSKRKTCEELEPLCRKTSRHDDNYDVHGLNSFQQRVEQAGVGCDSWDGGSLKLPSTKPTKTGKDNSKENAGGPPECDNRKNSPNEFSPVTNREPRSTESTEASVDPVDSKCESRCGEDMSELFTDDFSNDTSSCFESFMRCRVLDVDAQRNGLSLTVASVEQPTEKAIVKCSGFWRELKVHVGDIVAIKAARENTDWIIDNLRGFIVVHPDVLISSTTIAAGTFCRRKAVLAERFRKVQSLPYNTGNQKPLVIGSLSHQLLQRAIVEDLHQMKDITDLMDKILSSKSTLNLLYESNLDGEECRSDLLAYARSVHEFIRHYVKGKRQTGIINDKNNFKGSIVDVKDIEECIWCPELGLKGKVDITVEVEINSRRRLMPLEIKTGTASFSAEHRGQIALYVMMLSQMGHDTSSGLLLYLRNNLIQEIGNGQAERRDLLLLRNQLADSLKALSVNKIAEIGTRSDLPVMHLPEPINHRNACAKCCYNALCCSYLGGSSDIKLPEGHPLTKIGEEVLEKVKPEHIDYIQQWISLLQIEEIAQTRDYPIESLWSLSPTEREKRKTCISCLSVTEQVIRKDLKYKHTFARLETGNGASAKSIPHALFAENEYVLVSTDTRVNISAGFVIDVTEQAISVSLDRDITQNHAEPFHIDKNSSSNLVASNMANVGGLMGDDEVCERLRSIVIDKKPATFEQGVSAFVVEQSAILMKALNKNQQRAILKALTMKDYMLIKGMPGTGKTQTLVSLIQLLAKIGYTVLITAHTNSALDNILLKLLDKRVDFLRLGSSSTHSSLKSKTDSSRFLRCDTPKKMDELYNKINVVGVTCYGAYHMFLTRRKFDVCIVDESAQVSQPTILRPLYNASKFVLVGDPDQLPPIIKSREARKFGADESLFARLDSKNNTVVLTQQYRMNKTIMGLANKLTYNDQLEMGDQTIADATFVAPCSVQILCEEAKWLRKALSQDIDNSVIVINTGCTKIIKVNGGLDGKYPESEQGTSNILEGALVGKLIALLLKMGVEIKNIGVIAPYRAHVNLLRSIVLKDIEINTVDQYQGRDKEIIIYSCAKSLVSNGEVKEDLEVLGDHRRLTVAITRAKRKLILIGDMKTISQYSTFKKLFSFVDNEYVIDLTDRDVDFSWNDVTSLL